MGGSVELLVFTNNGSSMAPLASGLVEHGFAVDVVSSLAAAHGMFLERGGHTLLIIAPDVGTGRAQKLIEQLRSVDKTLTVIVFGEDTLRGDAVEHVHRIGFHPGSRAGLGGILKILCCLPAAGNGGGGRHGGGDGDDPRRDG